MKSTGLVFSVFFSAMLFVACVSSESEMLKQARSIQNDLLAKVHSLDSSMDVRLKSLNAERAEMAQDTLLAADSIRMQKFMMTKERIDNLSNLQSSLTEWKSSLTLLPSIEEMEKGAQNPFGDKVKDQEILQSIKSSQEAFNELELKANAAMK